MKDEIRFCLVVPAVVAVLGSWGCRRHQASGPQAPPPVPVQVAKAERHTLPRIVLAVGTVVSPQTVQVRPRVGGLIVSVGFQEGQLVAQGQLLFQVDPEPYRVALREAEARLARDQALLAKAKADLERAQVLAEKDFISKEQLDQARANVQQLQATVAGDQAAVDQARLQLSYCQITAPMSGRAGELLVHPGNLVKANDDKAMVTIVQVQPIDVSFAIPEAFLEDVRAALTAKTAVVAVKLRGDQEKALQGELFFVDNAVDNRTGTVLLKARFANEQALLWPGQFVDVSLVLGEDRDALVVPATAVITTQTGSGVFVVTEDGTAELREVQVARKVEPWVALTSGVSPGETVVTDGHIRLVPGARVQVRQGL